MDDKQNSFSGWARVEVMGHQSHIGHVTTEAYGQAVLFRIDRPELPEVDETLKCAEWVGEFYAQAGSVVRRAKLEAASVLVGSGSIYRIIPCDEATAMAAIRQGERRPLMVVKLADVKAIEAPESNDRLCEGCDMPLEPGQRCPDCDPF
jgi:hypothetical protein